MSSIAEIERELLATCSTVRVRLMFIQQLQSTEGPGIGFGGRFEDHDFKSCL